MKILIVGANGQLGKEIAKIIKNGKSQIGKMSEAIKSAEVELLDIDKLDISRKDQVFDVIGNLNPDVIINCAAFTNVDLCEEKKTLAFNVNTLGARNLAMIADKISAKFVQVSTDYVFSGDGKNPYGEYDNTLPNSIYGKTKLMGEDYVKEFSRKYFIVRTAWLYGEEGNNFVYTMMKLGNEKEELIVVDDQRGNPTNANDLAHHILKLIETEEYGVYHCTGEGECSWYDFAVEIMKLSKRKCSIRPCTTEMFPRPAKRPAYSSLQNVMLESTIGNEMRNWKVALEDFIANNKNL